MDLQVQNAIDDLDIRQKQFFMNCRKAKPDWREQQFKNINEEYKKALEDAEEKVNIATQIYDLVDRHLRKLDQELSKFKMELEADNAGITEILEQRSLRLDEPLNPPSPAIRNHITTPITGPYMKRKFEMMGDIPNGDHLAIPNARDYQNYSPLAYNQMSTSPKPAVPQPQSPSITYTLGTMGAGSAAVAAAQAQAVTNTSLQLQHQNRRGSGAGLKSSYGVALKSPHVPEYMGLGGLPSSSATGMNGLPSITLGVSSYDSTPTTVTPVSVTVPAAEAQVAVTPASTGSRNKNKKTKVSTGHAASAAAQVQEQDAVAATQAVPDWVYDPNEPRYCLCNQVSYGEMVGCDNTECPIEWFHYGCVGITDPPKGKWYCPQCSDKMKQRRGGRHK